MSDFLESVGKKARMLPNLLTVMRVVIVPFFVFFLACPSPSSNSWAVLLFIIASFTDLVDGYVARIFNAHSTFGKVLDPLADKILVMSALVMLASSVHEPRVPGWVVVLLLSREMVVTGLRSLAALHGLVVPASRLAKHKTFWTMIAVTFLLINTRVVIFEISFDCYVIGMIFLCIALVYSMFTGIAYAFQLRHLLVEGLFS